MIWKQHMLNNEGAYTPNSRAKTAIAHAALFYVANDLFKHRLTVARGGFLHGREWIRVKYRAWTGDDVHFLVAVEEKGEKCIFVIGKPGEFEVPGYVLPEDCDEAHLVDWKDRGLKYLFTFDDLRDIREILPK